LTARILIMDLPSLTDKIILGTTVALVIYNIAVGLLSGGDATISVRLQYHAARFPALPFIVGALCGHWFWAVRGIRG
jgi:hypothetical protein